MSDESGCPSQVELEDGTKAVCDLLAPHSRASHRNREKFLKWSDRSNRALYWPRGGEGPQWVPIKAH